MIKSKSHPENVTVPVDSYRSVFLPRKEIDKFYPGLLETDHYKTNTGIIIENGDGPPVPAWLFKRCSKCKKAKWREEFPKHKSRKDGLNSWCKKCVAEYYRTPKNKAKIKEYHDRPENKAKAKLRRSTPENIAKEKEYRNRPKVKAREKLRYATPEYKARGKIRRSTPEYQAWHKEYRKLHKKSRS